MCGWCRHVRQEGAGQRTAKRRPATWRISKCRRKPHKIEFSLSSVTAFINSFNALETVRPQWPKTTSMYTSTQVQIRQKKRSKDNHASTKVHKETSRRLQKYTSKQVLKYTSTQVNKYTSTQTQKYRIKTTQVHQYISTQVYKYTSIQRHKYTSTETQN